MGKRIELTEVYRQPRPASSSGRTSDFGSEKARSNRAAGTKKIVAEYHYIGDPEPITGVILNVPVLDAQNAIDMINLSAGTLDLLQAIPEQTALELLAHKRAVKAASMRRYRAKLKDKK